MAGNFHRLVTPSYYVSAGTFPSEAGVTYDYINNGGSGTPSFADNAKVGGTNAGTYFFAFQEDATSSNFNRGLKALAQNCDHLDDLLHRNIAIPLRTSDVVASGTVTSIVLPAGTYLGPAGTTNTADSLANLFEILDAGDEEIISGSNTCRVSTVTLSGGDALAGNNFSTNTVTLNISPGIPDGATYRVYYSTRGNLATLPADAFSFINIRGANEVDGAVQYLLQSLHGGTSPTWTDNWASTIYDLAYGGLDREYRTDSVMSAAPTDFFGYTPYPLLGAGDAGSGGWININGVALTLFSQSSTVYRDPLNAALVTKFQAQGGLYTSGGQSGIVVQGARRLLSNNSINSYASAETDETLTPEFATFLSLISHSQTNASDSVSYTKIPVGTACSLSTPDTDTNNGEAVIELTDTANAWFRDASGNTGLALGATLIQIEYTLGGNQKEESYLVMQLGSSADSASRYKIRVRRLDGKIPDFTGSSSATVRTWHSIQFGIGDGALANHNKRYSDTNYVFDSFMYVAPPANHNPTVAPKGENDSPAKFFSHIVRNNRTALSWGGVDVTTGVPTVYGNLMSEGGVVSTYSSMDVVNTNRVQPKSVYTSSVDTSIVGTPQLDLTEYDTFIITCSNSIGGQAAKLLGFSFDTTPDAGEDHKALAAGAKFTIKIICDEYEGMVFDGTLFPSTVRSAVADEYGFFKDGEFVIFTLMYDGSDFDVISVSYGSL